MNLLYREWVKIPTKLGFFPNAIDDQPCFTFVPEKTQIIAELWACDRMIPLKFAVAMMTAIQSGNNPSVCHIPLFE